MSISPPLAQRIILDAFAFLAESRTRLLSHKLQMPAMYLLVTNSGEMLILREELEMTSSSR